MDALSVVFPSFRCAEYAEIVIRSFERFKPVDMHVRYVVVENSDDASYRNATLTLAHDVIWVQNPLDMEQFPANHAGSYANAFGLSRGLDEVKTEWTFIAHSDVCVTSPGFFSELSSRVAAGDALVGTGRDNIRVRAIHISGLLASTDVARNVSLLPRVDSGTMVYDVGDSLDLFCRGIGLQTSCMSSTANDPMLAESLPEPFTSFNVDRCISSSGEVVFMHLGRGTPKALRMYGKAGRVSKDEWVSFCQAFV